MDKTKGEVVLTGFIGGIAINGALVTALTWNTMTYHLTRFQGYLHHLRYLYFVDGHRQRLKTFRIVAHIRKNTADNTSNVNSLEQVISPATMMCPLVAITSQATREDLSFLKHASKMLSEIGHIVYRDDLHNFHTFYIYSFYFPFRADNNRSIKSSCGLLPPNPQSSFLTIW